MIYNLAFRSYPQLTFLAQYFEMIGRSTNSINNYKSQLMKKTISLMAGIALSLAAIPAFAQTPTTQTPTTTTTTTTTTTVNPWDAKKNPTVDSINAKYKDSWVPARAAVTTNDIFPALGSYTTTVNTDAPSVVVTLDETNKGTVWIDGLPQGRVKAYLRKSPSTYKIPAQKTADGKDVGEGTLIFDKDANTLNIVIGKTYNAEDPGAVFITPTETVAVDPATVKVKNSKVKAKVVKAPKAWTYTGTKVEVTTAMTQ
jgi:hypothetical protein